MDKQENLLASSSGKKRSDVKMVSASSPDDHSAPEPPTKKLRRSYVACHRCHSHKIKCSGETPCRSCRKSNNSSQCVYPVRDRKVVISESYLKKLEAENAALKRTSPTPPSQDESSKQDADADDSDVDVANVDVANPLLEEHVQQQRPAPFDRASGKPLYIGGAACTAFGTRLRFYVKGNDMVPQPRRMVCYKHRGLLRIANTEFQLPNKTYARMLVQVVLRFIGSDYHLIQRKSFLRRMDETYTAQTHDDPVFLCRLFVVFALGELYSKKTAVAGNRRTVPGTAFFLQAMSLFQDLHEEADVDYIETLLIMSFYSHALNRKNTAYTYAGLALRLSLTLGLHRNITYDKSISAVEIENRRRVWWTVYTFDRMCSSKLGHPVMIRDEDIDAPLPSTDGLTPAERDEFLDAEQLIANVKLARITGNILNLIYSIPGAQQEINFVRNVHKILNSLKEWDATLPASLRLDPTVSPPYKTRSIASLRLHFNQCIILTTRPILLYVFKYHVRPAGSAASPNTNRPLSPMTTALSEACIHAARSSNKLLAQLWIDGAIATFGYFDAHYIFSSTIVLLMANILNPSEFDKDSIDLAWSLLQSMADDGNLPASEYCERLALLQKDLDDMSGNGGDAPHELSGFPGATPHEHRPSFDAGLKMEPHVSPELLHKTSPAPSQTNLQQHTPPTLDVNLATGERNHVTASVNQFIKSLQATNGGMTGENSVPWAFAWEAGELQTGFNGL
ncbi:C6 transcription factor [Lasiodiplodia theobromae]|uniref:C6 transcription factor n=1 Tax=Lasiodiplodia theobromae TaxID=45133 RepID=UPI0015C33916|nr:C6 transcription factor [Lasiodiplodia theobromae]KAF4539541.1 C6 transcription factor [Lasiodiplodia theobromae]